jgi:protein-disulfide isomerase
MGADAITALVARALNGTQPSRAPAAEIRLPTPPVSATRVLSIGEKAPRLPLSDLQGRPVELASTNGSSTLLVFWNPACGFCNAMLDDIKAWEAGAAPDSTRLLLVSTGSVEENLAMGLQCQIALDQNFSVGQLFGATGTPSAVLLDAKGAMASNVAAGGSSVMALASDARTAARTLKPPRDASRGRGRGARARDRARA